MKLNWKWNVAQNLELKWWKRYLKNKPINDYLAWKKAYWLQFLKDIRINETDLQQKSILDAGCGPAGIFTILKQSKVTALDPLLEQYSNLTHFDKAWYSNVSFINSSIEQFQSDKKYDYIFCLNAINHVADIQLAYSILIQHLNEHGKLIISTDAHRFNFLKWIFKTIPGDALHPHQYNIKEYEQFLTDKQLQIQNRFEFKANFIFNYVVWIAKK